MKTKLGFKTNSSLIDNEQIDYEKIAYEQWLLLDAFEQQYLGRVIGDTEYLFEDAIWFKERVSVATKPVRWDTHLQNCGKALQILIKSVFCEYDAAGELASNTFNSKINILKNSILGLIINKKLLAGNQGEFCLSLVQITDSDLLIMLDKMLANHITEKSIIQECSEISQFVDMVNHLSESVPMFEITANFPWVKAGLTISKWVSLRAKDLDIKFRPNAGYKPIVPETIGPLVIHSQSIITDYGDLLGKLTQIIRDYQGERNLAKLPYREILEQYSPIFSKLVNAPSINTSLVYLHRCRLVYNWLRKILFLARGACTNIVLLTSGLRNSDMRELKVGSCEHSGRVDVLYYLYSDIIKTKNAVEIPVPPQTYEAVMLLEKMKVSDSEYLIDVANYQSKNKKGNPLMRIENTTTFVRMLRGFADHFQIPFTDPVTGEEYSAHNYRATVAGWLDSHSNLSILMIRRLFGHSNDVMPTSYLLNNPAFILERKEQKERSAKEVALQMALATSEGKVAGKKGEQLIRGFELHKSRLDAEPNKSHSLVDTELYTSFAEIIEQRLLNESLCGFLTPFGVRCMRNPSDSSQPPCAKRSHRNKTMEIDEEILRHINDISPQHCIGTSCDEALLGPWSESIKQSIVWYGGLLHQNNGDNFTEDHFKQHAISFIKQYSSAINKVFKVEVLSDGTIIDHTSAERIVS